METLADLETLLAAPLEGRNRVALTCAVGLCASLRERFAAVERGIRQEWDALEAREAAQRAAEEAARQAAALISSPGSSVSNLRDLIRAVPNTFQQDILLRLNAGSEAERLYLVGYTPNTSPDRKKAHVQGAFTIMGSMNARGERSEYAVQLYKPNTRPVSFWCNCPDHKFKSSKNGTLCKHISFLLVRYAKLLCPDIFSTKCLNETQARTLADLLERPLRECPELRGVLAVVAASFLVAADRVFAEDDVCPICYEGLETVATTVATTVVTRVACPDCKQCMHQDCVKVWLERKDTCVMCRSEVWKHFRGGVAHA